jgi:glycosyltransferase involved in cell wall biosynthesis
MGQVTQQRTDQPLVSIVTPFFNTDEFLEECIASILLQSYTNWEYILVNNCSNDNSREIAEKYARADDRIVLIDNEELLNQVDNYNKSLTHISPVSKYCKIVQADDWIFPECLSRMVEVGEAFPSTSIVGAYSQVGDNVYLSGLPYPSTCQPGGVPCRKFLLDGVYVFGTPTSVMFRSNTVREKVPFFATDSPVEDAEICLELLKDSDFGFVHQVLTYTRTDNESITKEWKTYNPMLLTEVLCCRKFGRSYLSDAEYLVRMGSLERQYWRFLGESVLRRNNRDFWSFHERGLQSISESFMGWRKFIYTVAAFLDLCLNPKSTIERLMAMSSRPK